MKLSNNWYVTGVHDFGDYGQYLPCLTFINNGMVFGIEYDTRVFCFDNTGLKKFTFL